MRAANYVVMLVLLLCSIAACSTQDSDRHTDQRAGAGSGGDVFDNPTAPGGPEVDNPTAAAGGNPSNAKPTPGCGNGMRTSDEACDDGNKKAADGCSADCRSIEVGYSCQMPGQPCRQIARCGDGFVASSEACDDGDTENGDGCSERCRVEPGMQCSGTPSKCSATVCGNKKQEGVEGCDDGNALPFDGCSASCLTEPNCKGGACTSKCGDGLVLNEDCDDGNTRNGDGCSSSCKIEAGFMCTTDTSCEKLDGKCILRVPAIYRDFDEKTQSDFGIGCSQLTKGVVQNMLNADNKPVLANGGAVCIQSASSFAEWYTNNAKNAAIVGELTLFENGKGGYVNRFGANGEQFAGPGMYSNVMYGGNAGMGCAMCTPSASGRCYDPCTPWNSNAQACCAEATDMVYDGSPLFFPIDAAPNALPEMRYRAKLPEQYGYNGWPWEDSIYPMARLHNFHFTTEVVYWFKYEAMTSAALDFTGDDDVWVFVNGRLAVDLGGPHVPENGSVTIDATTAQKFALAAGNVYEIRVFHAERKVEGSSFRLTLSGFNTSPSDCTPICGDGIVTAGEECDDGTNDGGYEECQKGCVLGARCGDGIIQEGEDCDDANRSDGDSCGSSCRVLVLL